MKFIDKRQVLSYVAGDEFDDDTLEDLENDPDFMLAVLKFTKDKKFLRLCSNELKRNFTFIKDILVLFQDDKDFIVSIAKDWLDHEKKCDELNLDVIELSVLMCDLLKNTDEYTYFAVIAMANYVSVMTNIAMQRRSCQNPSEFGMGYIIIDVLFDNRDLVKTFFAKRMLHEIFYENDAGSFDDFIKLYAHNKNIITVQGNISFLINLLCNYDLALSHHVAVYPELLNDINKDLERTLRDWDYSKQHEVERKVILFIKEIEVFYDAHISQIPWFTSTELIEHMIRKFKLEELFLTNPGYAEYRRNNPYTYDRDIDKNFVRKDNIVDMLFYDFAYDLANELFCNVSKENKITYILKK